MLKVKLVSTDSEIDQMAELSLANLRTRLSSETMAQEGFITWEYTSEALHAVHQVVPSVVVLDRDVLAGYAISLTSDCIPVYPPMAQTWNHISSLRNLGSERFYLMGQICVAPSYRGQGVVDLLYQGHRSYFSPDFDFLATEISTSNVRSRKAHLKVGFEIIDTYRDAVDQWDVVLWDWR
jgi:hypothetical protein